jgi:hypothetical protein
MITIIKYTINILLQTKPFYTKPINIYFLKLNSNKNFYKKLI